MKIIGCDFHPSYQQIAMLDQGTGELVEKALSHQRKEEVQEFYAGLPGPVRVGIEASGQSQWFERLLAELGHELWIGDAGKIRARSDRRQKTDRRDAELICSRCSRIVSSSRYTERRGNCTFTRSPWHRVDRSSRRTTTIPTGCPLFSSRAWVRSPR